MSQPLATFELEDLDRALRLYTRAQLADLASCDVSTVSRAIRDAGSPLRYTHERGRRRYVDHATARAWLDSLAIDSESAE